MLREWLAGFRPDVLPYGRLLLTLAIGLAGGAVFSLAALPLPWMLGPMVFSMLAGLARAPVAMPAPVRTPMLVVLGLMVGASATPELVAHLPGWLLPLAGLFVAMVAGTLVSYAYFRRFARHDRTTAYYSSVPGGLTEMVLLSDAEGGRPQVVALAHAVRVAAVVLTVPFLVQLLNGAVIGARPASGVPLAEVPLAAMLWFLAAALIGAVLAGFVTSPIGPFVFPLLISAGLHASGLSDFPVPRELGILAQLVIGLSLGCRFHGMSLRALWRDLAHAGLACLLAVAVALAVALVFAGLSGTSLLALLLAYSPGGVAEMSLVAFTLQIEVAFVVLHHLVRLVAVALFAHLAYRVFLAPKQGAGAAPAASESPDPPSES